MKQTTRIVLAVVGTLACIQGSTVMAWADEQVVVPNGSDEKVFGEKRALTLDIAWDCRTFNYMRGLQLDQIVRGDRFMMNGTIYPGGTLARGNQTNDPSAPGGIGSWVGRGASTGSLAEHLANPTQPAIYWTQYVSLSNGMIVTEGWHAAGGANENAVVGGSRAFRGASGDTIIESLGTNSTGCDNTRYRIILTKRD